MTALEAVQAVQYVTIKEKRFALIDADEWEALIDALEKLEDLQIFKEAYTELQAAGGNREQAGWRRWQDVRDELT
ncbi:MAG: hypothetical protein NT075_31175 [Chloroflexi bacterium]|nr:hypothetical protein [Chloroflexota bacterium]